jgi:hypothetical protein
MVGFIGDGNDPRNDGAALVDGATVEGDGDPAAGEHAQTRVARARVERSAWPDRRSRAISTLSLPQFRIGR